VKYPNQFLPDADLSKLKAGDLFGVNVSPVYGSYPKIKELVNPPPGKESKNQRDL